MDMVNDAETGKSKDQYPYRGGTCHAALFKVSAYLLPSGACNRSVNGIHGGCEAKDEERKTKNKEKLFLEKKNCLHSDVTRRFFSLLTPSARMTVLFSGIPETRNCMGVAFMCRLRTT